MSQIPDLRSDRQKAGKAFSLKGVLVVLTIVGVIAWTIGSFIVTRGDETVRCSDLGASYYDPDRYDSDSIYAAVDKCRANGFDSWTTVTVKRR
jgi:hypothetical protein